jgi:hypothetical protein
MFPILSPYEQSLETALLTGTRRDQRVPISVCLLNGIKTSTGLAQNCESDAGRFLDFRRELLYNCETL